MSKLSSKPKVSDSDYARVLAGIYRAAKGQEPAEQALVLEGIFHALEKASKRDRGRLVNMVAGNLSPDEARTFFALLELSRIDEFDLGVPFADD